MSVELKTCPFCGGPAKLIHTMGLWAEGKYGPHGSKIICDYDNTCKAHVASHGDDQVEKAAIAWNTRAYEPDQAKIAELQAEVERLREALEKFVKARLIRGIDGCDGWALSILAQAYQGARVALEKRHAD